MPLAQQHPFRVKTGLGILVLSIATSFSSPLVFAAEATPQHYTIHASTLEAALNDFGRKAGILLTFDAALVQGISSTGLSGEYTPLEGLSKLLDKSGLEAVINTDGSYRIQKAKSIGKLAAVKVTAQATTDGTTEGTGSYTTNAVSVGGKTARDPRHIQQSVSVVTAQRIRDQNLTTAEEMLGQSTGITMMNQGGYAANASFISRGFTMGIQTDGGAPGLNFIWYHTGLPDSAILDHVEVLRGSDGLYGGAGSPGGTVNLVRKRPLDQQQVVFDALIGSWDRVRTQIDATGPLGFDGELRGRFVVAEERREYFYDTADSNKTVLYGVLEGDLTDSTLVSVGVSYEQQNRKGVYEGVPRYADGGDLGLARENCLCSDWSGREDDSRELFFKLEQALGDDWRFRTNLSRQWLDYNYRTATTRGAIDPLTKTGATLFPMRTDVSNEADLADVILDGNFNLFGFKQELIFGYNRQDMFSYGTGVLYTRDFPAVDVFNFNPLGYPQPATPATYVPLKPFGGQTQSGVYVSLRTHWTDSLFSVVGLRNSNYEYNYAAGDFVYKESDINTPYFGLNYDLTQHITLYASYAQIFESQAGDLDVSAKPLKAVEGDTYELGAKGSWFDNALTASAALYQIQRKNDRQQVFSSPEIPNCCYAAVGEIESQGFDMEVTGELAPGWQMTVGYTYNTNERKSGYGEENGSTFSTETPKHLLKLWTMAQLQGDWAKVRVGGGVNWQSDNYVSGQAATFNPVTNRYDGPGVPFEYIQDAYAVVGLRGEYQMTEHWDVALNVNNLFDETYYQTVGTSTNGNYYGEPRNLMVSFNGRW